VKLQIAKCKSWEDDKEKQKNSARRNNKISSKDPTDRR